MKFKVRRSANKETRNIYAEHATEEKLTVKVVLIIYVFVANPFKEKAKRLMKMFCLIYDKIRVAWENRLTLIKSKNLCHTMARRMLMKVFVLINDYRLR